MTASTSSRPLPGPFVAAVVYAIRVCVPPKRWALLALPVAGAVLFGLLAGVVDEGTAAEDLATVAEAGLFSLVLPFACLVVGDAVLGAEVRAGTFALTWLSPVPFPTIVIARWLAGWIVAVVALVPAFVAAAFVAGVSDAAGAMAVVAIAGSAAYVGLFVFVGAAARRATLWSVVIVLLGERLLGTALSGIAQLSPQWLTTTSYAGLGPDADELVRSGVPSGWSGVVRLGLVTVITLVLATWRVRHLKLTGKED